MSVEELKQSIEQRAGIPAALLNGETEEENIAQAKALLAYKKDFTQEAKSAKEQFTEWLKEQQGANDPDELTALEELEARADAGYPKVIDAGEVRDISKATAAEQFAEWLTEQTAYNPFKH